MSKFEQLKAELTDNPEVWLVTGAAGFIGSNLVEALLRLNQFVVGLDNFSTGFERNLKEIEQEVTPEQWKRFHFIKGDICNSGDCDSALTHPNGPEGKPVSVQHILHQAALGSVPRSIDDPVTSNASNVSGFLNMLVAAKDKGVESFTYAASSSTYGDHPALPKIEDNIGKPLSPYAVTKYVNELYADVFAKVYGFKTIGLRYFNVFGQRQNPEGAYAAVIPRWTIAMIRNQKVAIFGDGETSRDFSYIENAVQMNILAAKAPESARNEVYNMALGDRTTLNTLFDALRKALAKNGVNYEAEPEYKDFRPGDVRHSQADVTKAAANLGYEPTHRIYQGIEEAMRWYVKTWGQR